MAPKSPKSTTRTRSKSAAEHHGYEFGGPIGAFGVAFGLPIVCYLFAFLCNDISGCPAPSVLHPSTFSLDKLKAEVGWPGFAGLYSNKVMLATLGYYALSFFLFAILPKTEAPGVQLTSGGRLTYRLNAFTSALATAAILVAGTLAQGTKFPVWDFIWNNYVQLLTANIIISHVLAAFVYLRSFQVKPGGKPDNRELAAGGHSGNMLYDWFIGRELNPPITLPLIGHIDIKSFMEIRPGLLGWIILDFAFMVKQYKNYGFVTDSIVIVTLSQAVYVFDALYMEPAILTTIDITTDGFGFMLAFGDLVWVPFTYALHARYLAMHPVQLGVLGCLGVFGVQGLGYYIFRSSNNEKNRFRTNPDDPKVSHLSFIQTKTGSKLITSGWWGRARHINYLGDWVMSWAYCLPTGLAGYVIRQSSPFRTEAGLAADQANLIRDDYSLAGGREVLPGEARGWGMFITYFFMLYFGILLIHREMRDEAKCRAKYKGDWETYVKKVPYRIIPYVY